MSDDDKPRLPQKRKPTPGRLSLTLKDEPTDRPSRNEIEKRVVEQLMALGWSADRIQRRRTEEGMRELSEAGLLPYLVPAPGMKRQSPPRTRTPKRNIDQIKDLTRRRDKLRADVRDDAFDE